MLKVKSSLLSLLFLFTLFTGCQQQFSTDPVEVENSLSKPGGSALSFDGVDDYVNVPHDASLNATNALTISAWVYFEGAYPIEYASVVTKGEDDITENTNGPNNYTLHSNGAGGFYLTAETTLGGFLVASGNAPLTKNTWHHVAVTFSYDAVSGNSEVKFYINGVMTSSTIVITGNLVPNTSPIQIGFDPPGTGEYWAGKIDEVKIWNEVLSASQIRTAMSAATPVARALMSYWRFNEGRGLTARDRSSNGNDGLLMNGAAWAFPGAI